MTGAYEFICAESSTGDLCTSLNALGGWQWSVGDSHWYGDYLMCRPFPGVRIRIIDFPSPVNDEYMYQADVRLASECNTPISAIDESFRKVLALIRAHNIKEIEPFD